MAAFMVRSGYERWAIKGNPAGWMSPEGSCSLGTVQVSVFSSSPHHEMDRWAHKPGQSGQSRISRPLFPRNPSSAAEVNGARFQIWKHLDRETWEVLVT